MQSITKFVAIIDSKSAISASSPLSVRNEEDRGDTTPKHHTKVTMTSLRMEHVSFIRKILKKIPVFSRLDKVEQSTLAARMELRDFKKNAKIVSKDEKMSWFGIIWKGKVCLIPMSDAHVLPMTF